MSSFLLDTNALVAKMNGNDEVNKVIIQAENIYLPVIAVGEALYGAEKSAKTDANKRKVEDIITQISVLDCTAETARIYGLIEMDLRTKGRPIPQNDVWIAAIALQYDLVLLTKDKHFDNVNNLETQDW